MHPNYCQMTIIYTYTLTHTHTHTHTHTQDNLMPASGGRHQSHSSYYESISPPPAIQEQEEQQSSSATPNSGSGGKVTPTTPTNAPGGPTITNQTLQVGKSGLPEVQSPPLPPFYSPEGSFVQSVQSGPYLDPPAEFSTQSTPASQLVTSPVTTKPHPPANGGIRHQQEVDGTVASSDPDQQAREMSPFDVDQPLIQANSNGNNSNSNERVVPMATEDHCVNTYTGTVNDRTICSPSSRGLQKADINFPNHSNILTHSDNAEINSSRESGFGADNVLETTTAWYISPDSSPRSDHKVPRPKLGPQVAVGSTASPQNLLSRPPQQPRSPHGSDHMTHYQQYSGTASDTQSLGGSQKSYESSSISEYDRLNHERRRQQSALPLHEAHCFDGQNRASLPAHVEDVDPVYSEVYPAYPIHKASMSFDGAEILSERCRPRETARFMSPPHAHSARTKMIRNHIVFNGHSPTPGAPLSPVTLGAVATTIPSYQPYDHLSIRATDATTNYHNGMEMGVRHHSRSRSQPDDMVNVLTTLSPLIPHSNSQPYYTNNQKQLPALPEQRQHHLHHRHHHHKRDRSSSSKSGRHQKVAEQSAFKSSYPGHHKAMHKSRGKSHRDSDGRGNGRTGGNNLQLRIVANRHQLYADEGSQESAASGQGTPGGATPTLTTRQQWSSGNDSGFNSMNRDSKQNPILGAGSHHYSHSGACVSKLVSFKVKSCHIIMLV